MKNTFEIIYFSLNLCKKESVPNYLKKKEALYQRLWYVCKRKINNFVCKKNLCVIGQKRTLFKLLYQKQNPTKKNNYVCVDLCHTISTTTIFLPEN
jgi:hypothetical protein